MKVGIDYSSNTINGGLRTMKIKRIVAILFICLLMAPAVLVAQGGKESGAAPAQAVAEKEMTKEELIAAAQKEGTLTVYSPSSRHSKVGDEFGAKYGIKVQVTQLKDVEMIEKVSKEAAANLDAADVVFVQDGGRIYTELLDTGYITSYTPMDLRSTIEQKYQNPLQVWDLCTKVFIYNSERWQQPITNVWELTEPKWKGLVQMKDPFGEGVNMNFLTMITKDEHAKALADAYKKLYGKDLVLTTKNAGYEWIKMFFQNGLLLGKSDTTIAEQIGAKGQANQWMALFTMNKLRTAKDKNLALAPSYNVEPFSGFYYPIYASIPSNSRSVNAAKLFIDYALSEEGYAAFNQLGDYSPNPALKNTEDPVSIQEWDKMLIYEDPEWCAEARADVEEFLSANM